MYCAETYVLYVAQEIPQIETLDRPKGPFPDGNKMTVGKLYNNEYACGTNILNYLKYQCIIVMACILLIISSIVNGLDSDAVSIQ